MAASADSVRLVVGPGLCYKLFMHANVLGSVPQPWPWFAFWTQHWPGGRLIR